MGARRKQECDLAAMQRNTVTYIGVAVVAFLAFICVFGSGTRTTQCLAAITTELRRSSLWLVEHGYYRLAQSARDASDRTERTYLRRATLEGKLSCVYVHFPTGYNTGTAIQTVRKLVESAGVHPVAVPISEGSERDLRFDVYLAPQEAASFRGLKAQLLPQLHPHMD